MHSTTGKLFQPDLEQFLLHHSQLQFNFHYLRMKDEPNRYLSYQRARLDIGDNELTYAQLCGEHLGSFYYM